MSEAPLKRKVLTEKTFSIRIINKEEFEKYLNSIGGLINGHYTDRPPIVSSGYFCVGEGWFGILKNLIQESIDAGWNKQILQSKEKFGALRFYTNAAPEEVHNIISKYMNLSIETCEECGEPGKLRQGGWIRTLCDKHCDGTN